MTTKYSATGVDVHKKGIEVFKEGINNLFPDAFCVVQKDPDLRGYGLVTHTDGPGSKLVQQYLHYKETGDMTCFAGAASDTIQMNLGDIQCVGAYPLSFVDYISINKFTVQKQEFLETINQGFMKTIKLLNDYAIPMMFAGGETADLPDQLRTVDMSGTIVGRVKLSEAITGKEIEPGDIIIGLRSGGNKAIFENKPPNPLMFNGLTLTRHCLMIPDYAKKYPEISKTGYYVTPKDFLGKIFRSIMSIMQSFQEKEYYGRFKTDEYHNDLGMTLGEAIISPARLFAIPMHDILVKHREDIHGLVQNSGGGQTKCLRIGKNIHYVKDNLPDPDPIFYLVQEESGEEWEAMHENYNMGIGFDIICPERLEEPIIKIANEFNIEAMRTGYCEESDDKNKLTIESRFGTFLYE